MTFRWEINVIQYDKYGDREIRRTPMSVLGANKTEVTEKVRSAFNATFDDFRKFWSHGWSLKSVTEEAPVGHVADDDGRPEKPSIGIISDGGI